MKVIRLLSNSVKYGNTNKNSVKLVKIKVESIPIEQQGTTRFPFLFYLLFLFFFYLFSFLSFFLSFFLDDLLETWRHQNFQLISRGEANLCVFLLFFFKYFLKFHWTTVLDPPTGAPDWLPLFFFCQPTNQRVDPSKFAIEKIHFFFAANKFSRPLHSFSARNRRPFGWNKIKNKKWEKKTKKKGPPAIL